MKNHKLSSDGQEQRDAEDQLWAAFAANRSPKNRNALVEFHRNLAWKLALRYRSKQFNRKRIGEDEVVSEAIAILFKCIDRFDSKRGFRFSTYYCNSFFNSIGANLHGRSKVAKRIIPCGDRDVLIRDRPPTEVEKTFEGEVGSSVVDAIADLDGRSQLMIAQRFYQKMTFQEIGDHHGVTRERVRQLLVKAIRKIREKYNIPTPPWEAI